jgi:ABC-type spermidine/putrescine transport system permease subunit I
MSLHTPVSAAVAMLGQLALVVQAALLIEHVPDTVGQLALVVHVVPVWIEQ